jgi:hypothetical protein
MNFFKLSLVTVSLLLVGCGSDSKSDDNSGTKVTTIEEAETNMKSMGAVGNVGGAIGKIKSNNSKMQKLSKSENHPCAKSGNMSWDFSEDGTTTKITMNKCTENDFYMDGSMSINEQDSGYFKMEMNNLTIKSNGEDISSKHFIMEGNDNEYWSKIDGDMSLVSKCFSGTFDFKTLEKMYETQDGSDAVEKGKIELNGATYDFNYPNVTIKAGSESKTMLQSELDKEMESATTCDES